jgi:hypothetical protein
MYEHAQQRPAADCAYDCDVGQRNRIEQREVRVWALPPGSGVEPWHDHFLTLIEVRRTTEVFDTAKARFVPRIQTPAYYLSTLSSAEVTAREFAASYANTGASKTACIMCSTPPWPRTPAASAAIPASSPVYANSH